VDIKLILGILLDQLIKQLGVDAADTLLFDPRLQMFHFAASQGFHNPRALNTNLRLDDGGASRALRERRIVLIRDLDDAPSEAHRKEAYAREGFVSFVGVPLIAKGQVKGVLEIFQRSPFDLNPQQSAFLEILAGQAAIAIDNTQLFENLQGSNEQLMMAYDETIEGWSRAMDLRDKETEGHTRRVTEMTQQLATSMGFGPEDLVHIRRGALLHDIGKIGVPDEILRKPGPLTEEEWVSMRQHPQLAYDMLSPIIYLQPALDIPYCHHERWDGTGYPRRLKGEQIPLVARIFAVIDVWDALTSPRPYREALSEAQARQYVQEQSGLHFDPVVVKNFLDMR
jgi:HD-GYP domain-containing protein (c-di-GMP phosphodiesterase class II)